MYRVYGLVLAGGLLLGHAGAAQAQVGLTVGNPLTGNALSIGTPGYGYSGYGYGYGLGYPSYGNSSFYGGYGTNYPAYLAPSYGATTYSSGYSGYAAPGTTYYNSGYSGYAAPGTSYYSSGYYAPRAYAPISPSYGYRSFYGSRGLGYGGWGRGWRRW